VRQIARIQLSYQADGLSIVIDDDGLPYRGDLVGGPPASPAGHGIVGMRERVTALGGEFQAGPRPAGGFRVSATLPLAAAPVPSGPA
jgi:signal transduction histidine kinase